MQRGGIWRADLVEPRGSEPGFRRPVLVVQSQAFNDSRIRTAIVVSITSNAALGTAPGNVRLSRQSSRLPRESVVNVSQVMTLDKDFLTERISRLSPPTMADVEEACAWSFPCEWSGWTSGRADQDKQ